ncbi:hypothetical protein MB46_16590 [Arthrobacter alpinus]|nr:hypothetical protein MB46_16590 [Arthrobacter alpinus]
MSLDGYVAGPHQSLDLPFGEGVDGRLHRWMFEQPEANQTELTALTSAGAYIMGRNMFGPGRDSWDESWQGWWGPNPPYHGPVFVLSHFARDPLPMEGGTTFFFVTEGIKAALEKARSASAGANVAISGGAQTLNQYLAAGLVDELTVSLVPITIGAGERLFTDVGSIECELMDTHSTGLVTHLKYKVLPRRVGTPAS